MGKVKTALVVLCLVSMAFGMAYAGDLSGKIENTTSHTLTQAEKKCIEDFLKFMVGWGWKDRLYDAYSALMSNGRYSACEVKDIFFEYINKPSGGK